MPAKLRRELNIRPSDKVLFVKKNKGVIIRKLPSVASLFGSLANPKVNPLRVSQMNKLLERGMFSKNDNA